MASSNYKLRPGKLIFSDAEFSPFIHGLIQDELFSLHELGAFGYSILVYLILYSGGELYHFDESETFFFVTDDLTEFLRPYVSI